MRHLNSLIASICSIVLLQFIFIPYLQAREATSKNLAAEKADMAERMMLAGQLDLSLDSINEYILPEAQNLSDKLKRAGDSDADLIDKKIIAPVNAASAAIKKLTECDMGETAQNLNSNFIKGIQVDGCRVYDINLSQGLKELVENLEAVTGYIPKGEEDKLIADFYRDVLNQTRQNTISMYYNVASKYSEQMPSNPQTALNRIYGMGGMKAPQSILEDKSTNTILKELAKGQPATDEQRTQNRMELFNGFRNNLLDIYEGRNDLRQSRGQLMVQDSLLDGSWIMPENPADNTNLSLQPRDIFSNQGQVQIGQNFGTRMPSLFKLRNSGMFNPYRHSAVFDKSNLTLEPSLNILEPREPREPRQPLTITRAPRPGSSIPSLLKSRYGVEIERNGARKEIVPSYVYQGVSPRDAVASELDRAYPGQGEMLADAYIERMDQVFTVLPEEGSKDDTPRIVISQNRILDINNSALGTLPVVDMDGRENSFSRGNTEFSRRLGSEVYRKQGEARNNFLSWQGNERINTSIVYGLSDEKNLTNDALNATMKDFFANSLKLLEKIENEMADQDPRQGLKDAMTQNPGVIAQVLASNPKYAGIACKLSAEALEDQKDAANADNFWAIAGLVVFVGAVLLTGGLALAGAGAAYGLLISAGVGVGFGVAETAYNINRGNRLEDEAENLELYFQTQGVGDREKVKELRKLAIDKFKTAIWTGALTPLEVFGFFRGIRTLKGAAALKKLEKAAKNGGDAVALAKEFSRTKYADDITSLVGRSDRKNLKAAEKSLGGKLPPRQKAQIHLAHIVGKGEIGKDGINLAAKGNYTTAQLAKKARILEDFTQSQRRLLMEKGIVGLDPVARNIPQIGKEFRRAGENMLYRVADISEDGIVRYTAESPSGKLFTFQKPLNEFAAFANGQKSLHVFSNIPANATAKGAEDILAFRKAYNGNQILGTDNAFISFAADGKRLPGEILAKGEDGSLTVRRFVYNGEEIVGTKVVKISGDGLNFVKKSGNALEAKDIFRTAQELKTVQRNFPPVKNPRKLEDANAFRNAYNSGKIEGDNRFISLVVGNQRVPGEILSQADDGSLTIRRLVYNSSDEVIGTEDVIRSGAGLDDIQRSSTALRAKDKLRNLNAVGRVASKVPTSTADDVYFMRHADGELIGNYRINGYESKAFFDDVIKAGQKGDLSYDEFMKYNDEMHRVAALGSEGKTPYPTKNYHTSEISAGTRISDMDDTTVNFITRGRGYLRSKRIPANEYADEVIKKYVGSEKSISKSVDVLGVSADARPRNIDGIHNYPTVKKLNEYYQSAQKQFNSIVKNPRPRNASETKEVMNQISDYYHTLVNARPYIQVNNSLYMNQINALLRSKGMRQLTHAELDHLAHRSDYKDFRKIFELHYDGKLPSAKSLGYIIKN